MGYIEKDFWPLTHANPVQHVEWIPEKKLVIVWGDVLVSLGLGWQMADMTLMYKAARVYLNTCLAYGFTRSVTYDYKGTKRYYNEVTEKREEKDMLLVDKIGRITGGTCAALVMWPVMLGEDLARLECAVKGKDVREYQ